MLELICPKDDAEAARRQQSAADRFLVNFEKATINAAARCPLPPAPPLGTHLASHPQRISGAAAARHRAVTMALPLTAEVLALVRFRLGCSRLSQRHCRHDGRGDRDRRTDDHGQLERIGERAREPRRQRGAAWAGQLLRHRQGAAEGVARRLAPRRVARRARVRHAAAIDGGADAAEDGDAERAAELGAGLGNAGAAPARSGGAVPTIRSVARVNTGARPSENMTKPVTRAASP